MKKNVSGMTAENVRDTKRVRTRREATDADVVLDLKSAKMANVPVRNTLSVTLKRECLLKPVYSKRQRQYSVNASMMLEA